MRMDKITTGIAYGAAGSNTGFWLYSLLNSFSPEQWTAIGVLGGLFFALITCLVNVGFKIWDRKHNMVRRDED
ncbi:class II holin family protein [Rahnella sp. PCH160]|uniref:class II holin family protein n=1 Tax=Rahnella sp. PCH160 TaxID=3447928 RepID=UPI0039FC0A5E